MKNQYIFWAAIAVLGLVGCNKYLSEPDTRQGQVTLKAYLTDGFLTKSAYTLNGAGDTYEFAWVASDKFVVQTYNGEAYSQDLFTTTESGRTVAFTGNVTDGYSLQDYAFYPKTSDAASHEASSNLYVNTVQLSPIAPAVSPDLSAKAWMVQLPGTNIEDINHPMAHIPMIGEKDGSGDYAFTPCTGVLKVTFSHLPSSATQIRLNMSDNSYALNGQFVFDTNLEVKEAYKKNGYNLKYLNISHAAGADSDLDGYDDAPRSFFFPIPTGTIPAGKLTVSVSDGSQTLYSATSKKDIIINRAVVTDLPSITVPSIMVKIGGTATAPTASFYFSGEVACVKYKTRMSSYLTDLNTGTISTSGTTVNLEHDFSYQYYLGYKAFNSSDEALGELVTMRYYAITSTATSEVCKQFTSANSDIGLDGSKIPAYEPSGMGGLSPTITIEASDDARKGNIMVTEFCGLSGKTYGYYAQYANSTVKQAAPQIMITNTEGTPFCTIAEDDYYLHEFGQTYVRFAVKTTDVPTVSAYGKTADFCGWVDGTIGLSDWAANKWGPYVNYFYDITD